MREPIAGVLQVRRGGRLGLAWLLLTAGAAALTCGAGAARAQEADPLPAESPVTLSGFEGMPPASAAGSNTVVTAMRMTFDYKNAVAVFQGDVVVVDPELRLTSDELRVMFEDDNSIRSVAASGNVRVQQGDKRAMCDRATYIVAEGQVVLLGNAKVTRRRDAVMGKRITFWIDKESMDVQPGTLIVFPQKNRGLPRL